MRSSAIFRRDEIPQKTEYPSSSIIISRTLLEAKVAKTRIDD
jgi:hypothetical protein